MLTQRHDAKDSGDRSPFSSFRQRWMNGDQTSGLFTERRGWGDFSREDDRRALTNSFLRRDSRDRSSRSASSSNDFFRRHNTQKSSKFSESSKLNQRCITGDRGSKTAATGFSRFRATERFESSVSTDKGGINEIRKARKSEISESTTRKDGARTVQTARREESSVLRHEAEISSEATSSRIKSLRARREERSVLRHEAEIPSEATSSRIKSLRARREESSVLRHEAEISSEATTSRVKSLEARREESSVLRHEAEISSEATTSKVKSFRERRLERSILEKSKVVEKDDAKNGGSKTDSPLIARKRYAKSVETAVITTSTSDKSDNNIQKRSEDLKAETEVISTPLKAPPKVLRKPIPRSPVIRCEDGSNISDSPTTQRRQATEKNTEETTSNKEKDEKSESNEDPDDTPQRLSVSSLRHSLFGGDSTAFAAIAARGMGGTLGASPVTLRTRRATERRQVVSTTEIMQNGSITRSMYRMERKSESEVEICRNEDQLLPTLYMRFEKPKRKNIAPPSRDFRQSQLQITDGNETGDGS